MLRLISYRLSRRSHGLGFNKRVITAGLATTSQPSAHGKSRKLRRQTSPSSISADSDKMVASNSGRRLGKTATPTFTFFDQWKAVARETSGRGGRYRSLPLSEIFNTVVPLCNVLDLHSIAKDMNREAVLNVSQIVANLLLLDYSYDTDNSSEKHKAKDRVIHLIQQAIQKFIDNALEKDLEGVRAIRYPFLIVVMTNLSTADALAEQLALCKAVATHLRDNLNFPSEAKSHLKGAFKLFKKMFSRPAVWVMDKELSTVVHTGHLQLELLTGGGLSPAIVVKKLQANDSRDTQKSANDSVGLIQKDKEIARTPIASEAEKIDARGKVTTMENGTFSNPPPLSDSGVGSRSINNGSSNSGVFHNSEYERVVWQSPKDRPVDLNILHTLLDETAYTSLKRVSPWSLQPQRAPFARDQLVDHAQGEVRVVVYSLGVASGVCGAWLNAIGAVNRYCQDELKVPAGILERMASAEAHARSLFEPGVSVAALSAAKVKSSTSPKSNKGSAGGVKANKEKKNCDKEVKDSITMQTTPAREGVYLLIHASHLIGDDAQLLRHQIGNLYETLPENVREFFLGVYVIAQAQISLSNLVYLLRRTALPPVAPLLDASSADAGASFLSATSPPVESEARPEKESIFREAYRELAAPITVTSPAPSALTLPPHSHSFSPPAGGIPLDVLVEQSTRIAAVVESIVERREAQLRRQTGESLGSIYLQAQAEHDELARAAQTVELKTMITEAIEEVSARHEQATSHLVKSLSAMVGQWSPEKLFDAVEALLKERVNPLREDLQQLIASFETLGEVLGRIDTNLPAIKRDIFEVRTQIESENSNRSAVLSSEASHSTHASTSVSPFSSSSLERNEEIVQELARVLQDIRCLIIQWDASSSGMINAEDTDLQEKTIPDLTKILDALDKIYNQMQAHDANNIKFSRQHSALIDDSEVVEAIKQMNQLNVPALVNRIEDALSRVHITPAIAISSVRGSDTSNVEASNDGVLDSGDTTSSSEVATTFTPLEAKQIAESVFHQLKEYLIQHEVKRSMLRRRVLTWMQRQQQKRRQHERTEQEFQLTSTENADGRQDSNSPQHHQTWPKCWNDPHLVYTALQLLLLEPNLTSIPSRLSVYDRRKVKQVDEDKRVSEPSEEHSL
ncbi:unnamed protein product [Phytomonas sp. EM1]|nr:unnamed protein product [Phytomonas sp. EM1]|eukprot:CCW64700.1 unnamed protein product [Phytomonas sp. isolate EM1]